MNARTMMMNTKKIDTAKTLGKLGYATAIELSGTGDISRITAGVDPYTLENTDRVEEMQDYIVDFGWVNGGGYVSRIIDPRLQNRIESGIEYGQKSKTAYEGYEKMDQK